LWLELALHKSGNGAQKARNRKARGKREAKRSASPLVRENNLVPALKARNIGVYFCLSGLI
jgi:hypothetical protein